MQVPNSSGTAGPKLPTPANACDCHVHVYDGVRFPPRDSTVISPVPSSTLYILKGTSGTPHELVTVPSSVTV